MNFDREPDGYISGTDEDGTEWTMPYWLGEKA